MRRWAAGLVVLVVLATACSSDDDDATGGPPTTEEEEVTETTAAPEREVTAEAAVLEGPITVGRITPPADPRPVDLAAIGYTEEEFFASGTATAFAADGELTDDGQWDVTPDGSAPFRTRLIVRRPADPEDFDGTVVVEWFNVSAVEAAPDWSYLGEEIVDEGAAWVGVSVQALGIVGGSSLIDTGTEEQAATGGGIRASNPERYGSLEHPGDRFAFDIYTQVAAALRAPGEVAVFGDGEAQLVVAVGESQSAGFLTSYVNAVQPRTGAFDGFFIHSRGAGAARFDGEPAIRGSEVGFRIRDDIDVPVLQFETETDVGPLLRFAAARQPDGPNLRTWEVAGTAHADAYLVGGFPLCDHPINDGPQHYVAKAALDALLAWIEDGDEPPEGEPIESGGPEGTAVERDADGIALGGVRTPSVDVPVSVLSGEAPEDAELLCALFGSSTPFEPQQLADRYGSRDEYLTRFDAALDDAVERGFVRSADRDAYAADARDVSFPG